MRGAQLEVMLLKRGKGSDGKPLSKKDRDQIPGDLRAEADFLAEHAEAHPLLPTLTFDNALTLYRGSRELRLMKMPGNTAGDVVLYLPKEKILLTGDLLVMPVPYGGGSHIDQWISTLKQIDAMDTVALVPATAPCNATKIICTPATALLESIVQQVHAAGQKGLSFEETKKAVNLDKFRLQLTHDDPDLNDSFRGNFAEPILHQAWIEGPRRCRRTRRNTTSSLQFFCFVVFDAEKTVA